MEVAELEMAEPEVIESEMAASEMAEPEVAEIIQPMDESAIAALNTPEALSQIPRLPAVADRFASASTQDFKP